MREGFFLLHRQLLDKDAWKNPKRTLAWIDMISMADHNTAIVSHSYGFLAERWGVSKHTAYDWIQLWIGERSMERLPERDTERDTERWFIVNYAKYQQVGERVRERKGERVRERKGEQIETSTIRTGNNITSTDVLVSATDENSTDAHPPAPINSKTKQEMQKHLLPYAMFCYLFEIKFTSKEQRHVLFQQNLKMSKTLSDISPLELASAMLLMEDHWAKKQDFPPRLATVRKFLEDFGREGLPDHLQPRLQLFLDGFQKHSSTIFDLPTVTAHV